MSVRSREGFALIASLWAVTLLSTIALALGLEHRSRRLAALNRIETTRASYAADACLADARSLVVRLHDRAVQGTSELPPEFALDPWLFLPSVEPDTLRIGEAWCALRFEDPGAKLHLNYAGDEELGRLFIALRIDARRADRLAQAIMDWRDPDDAHRGRGAEARHYVEAGLPRLPTNRPFADVDELHAVLGMTPALYERIAPYVTTQGSGRVAVHSAPLEVLLALPGMTPDAAVRLLQFRRDGRRLADLSDLLSELPRGPASEIERNMQALSSRLALRTSDIVASVDAGLGPPAIVVATTVFVRSAGLVHLLDQRIE